MRFLSLLTALIFGLHAYAQDQQGYYIDNSGKRTEGFFKTSDFYDASSLEFRNDAAAGFSKLDTRNITEYGIAGQFKFRKYSVKIDRSATAIKKLSFGKDPFWESEEIFLNVVLEGKATLYSYSQDNTKFFYSLNGEVPQQLLYRKYKVSETEVRENTFYKQQLLNSVNCMNKPVEYFKDVAYTRSALIKVFKEHNSCQGTEGVEYVNVTSKGFKILLAAYVGAGKINFGWNNTLYETKKTSSTDYSLGAEVIFRAPSEKWEFFFRGELEKFSVEQTVGLKNSMNSTLFKFEIDALCVNAYMGLRYNLMLNDRNKIFFEGAVGFSVPNGTMKQYTFLPGTEDNNPQELDLGTAFSFNLGVGYEFNNKYGILLRYETPRDITGSAPINIESKVNRFGLNLRYTF